MVLFLWATGLAVDYIVTWARQCALDERLPRPQGDELNIFIEATKQSAVSTARCLVHAIDLVEFHRDGALSY